MFKHLSAEPSPILPQLFKIVSPVFFPMAGDIFYFFDERPFLNFSKVIPRAECQLQERASPIPIDRTSLVIWLLPSKSVEFLTSQVSCCRHFKGVWQGLALTSLYLTPFAWHHCHLINISLTNRCLSYNIREFPQSTSRTGLPQRPFLHFS